MNREGAEALVEAALKGIPQTRGTFHSRIKQAVCALGAMHLAIHDWDWKKALECIDMESHQMFNDYSCGFTRRYGVFEDEAKGAIVLANDREGWDFLTIARKLGGSE